MSTGDIILYSLRGVFVLAMVIFGWRELSLLLRRPAPNMGMGLWRTWAVARTTLLEAWAGRIWLLPILWLGAALLLLMTVRPFDESERIPLYIRMLLSSQEMLLLVMIWVMACVSLPRERERKILVTNASKPLSRLEIVMGKMLGYTTASALLLIFMGVCSLVILNVADYRLRKASAEAYQLQSDDYTRQGGRLAGAAAAAPSAALKRLADEGSLYAYNYITARKGGMSIVGAMDLSTNPPTRFVKGGSSQRIIYHFTRLDADDSTEFAAPALRPYFVFSYNMFATQNPPPTDVKLNLSVVSRGKRGNEPARYQSKTIKLSADGYGYWAPENPEYFLSYWNGKTGEMDNDLGAVDLDVTCETPGVLLAVRDGANPDPTTGAIPPTADFNVKFVADRNKPYTFMTPEATPQIHGFERYQRQEVAGPTAGELRKDVNNVPVQELAVYRFTGQDIAHVPLDDKNQFNLSMSLGTFFSEHPELPTIAEVHVQTMDVPNRAPFVTTAEVLEKRVVNVKVPAEYLGDTDPAKRGDMIVTVASRTPGHSISFVEDSVRIELPQSYFAVNLMKSEAIIFLEAILVIGLGVACSVRVGWPVAMLCSVVIMAFGYFVEFIATLPGYGGLGALNFSGQGTLSATYQFFDKFTLFTWRTLGAISDFVPNFSQFKPDEYITKLQSIPLPVMEHLALMTAWNMLPIIAVAYLLFRKQELG